MFYLVMDIHSYTVNYIIVLRLILLRFLRASRRSTSYGYPVAMHNHSLLILSLITRWPAISATEVSCGHITTMLDYAQIHIFDACGHYTGRLLLILILHNVMHDITSTLPVDVVPTARFTQNGRPMSIA